MIQRHIVMLPAAYTTSEAIRLYLNRNVSYGCIFIRHKDGEDVS